MESADHLIGTAEIRAKMRQFANGVNTAYLAFLLQLQLISSESRCQRLNGSVRTSHLVLVVVVLALIVL